MTDAGTGETLTATSGAGPAAHAAELARGSTVGRYVVLGKLGAGGMGVVFAAYDPELDRKVALKLLLGEGADARTRLLREAQALAKLSHPNIVAVHDVGTVGERVWIAMELVAGRSLRAWLDETRRPWRDVLAAVIAAGRGLAAAHAEGLVHRDFKPDNVMLGDDGRVRVMDFGLARVAASEEKAAESLEEDTAAHPARRALHEAITRAGAVAGTPAYMAAEQWDGRPTDARTDQFALCVTLWEGLYGERPFSGESLVEVAASVLEGRVRAPARGSRAPTWLRKAVERGLSPTPAERWPTTDALLHALARGQTRARLRRAIAALGAVATASIAVLGARELDERSRRAACEVEAGRIAEVWNDGAKATLHDALVATGVSYAESAFEHAVPLFDAQAATWRDTYAELCVATQVERSRSAELWQASRACLDDRRGELASLVEVLATEADAAAVQRTVTAAARLPRLDSCRDDTWLARNRPIGVDDAAVGELRRSLWRIGGLRAAGKSAQALELARAAVAQAEGFGHARLHRSALLLAGDLSGRAGDAAESERLLGAVFDSAMDDSDDDLALASASGLVYSIGFIAARHDDALWWGRIASGFARRLGVDDELDGARLNNSIGVVHRARGSYDEAQRLHEAALAIQERTLGPDHPDLSLTLNNLADVHRGRGSYGDARRLLERALAIGERAHGEDHPTVAYSIDSLAAMHAVNGDYDEALRLFERALAMRERIYEKDNRDIAASLNNLAGVHFGRGDYDEVLRLHERALGIFERTFGPNHPDVATSLGNIGNAHYAKGDLEQAREMYARSLSIWERGAGLERPDVAHALVGLASVELEMGRPRQAREYAERAVALRVKYQPGSELTARAQLLLAKALWRTGEPARARELASAARDVLREAAGHEQTVTEIERWLAEDGDPDD